MKLFKSLFLSLMAVSFANAEEHGLTRITGTHIDLKSADHAIAGSIKNLIIFGDKNEKTGTSALTFKKNGEIFNMNFARNDKGAFGGSLGDFNMHFVSLDAAKQTMTFSVNGETLVVQITADGFANNHFKNPRYTTEFRGEKIEFAMEDGQACYGFSAHLIFMILSAYFNG